MSNKNQPGKPASSDIWFIYARVDDETFVWIDDYEKLNRGVEGTEVDRQTVIDSLLSHRPPTVRTSYRKRNWGYVRGARVDVVPGKKRKPYLRTDADKIKANNLNQLEYVSCTGDFLDRVEDRRVTRVVRAYLQSTMAVKRLVARFKQLQGWTPRR